MAARLGTPTISVAMATFNGERHLREQLESLCAQTSLPAELVVSDDGSRDRTLAIAQAFEAPFPIRFFRNAKPLGYGGNFLQAAKACSGEWIAFCDQDDVWNAEKLAVCSEHMDDGTNLIAHNALVTDEDLKPVKRLYRYPKTSKTGPWELPPEWHCTGFTQVFHRRLLDIPFDRRVSFPWNSHRDAHDVWIALLANALGGIVRLNQPLALYRRHRNTVTGDVGHVASILTNHGDEYRLRAHYLASVADVLGKHFDVSRVELQEAMFNRRANAYLLPSVVDRLAAIGYLVAQGGYVGGRGWPFGIKRMLKDAAFAVRG